MLSKNRPPIYNRVTFRLALTYTLICTISLLSVLLVSYIALRSIFQIRLDEVLASEIKEYGALLKTQEIEMLQDILIREATAEGTDSVFFRVLDTTGKELFASDMRAWANIRVNQSLLLAATNGAVFFETHHPHNRVHAVRIAYGQIGNGLIMQLGESTAANIQTLKHFQYVFSIGTFLSIFSSMLVGVIMARRTLSGVRRVSQAAKNISAGKWGRRVPVSRRHDEIDELAVAFNEMVERIQNLIRELREVTDDIAHDLRTPITRMRVAAETTLLLNQPPENHEEFVGHILEECDHLLDLIKTMLEISETEAGARPLIYKRLNISALVKELYTFFKPASEDKRITLTFNGPNEILVDGEEKKLKRAIANILDNAIKYTEPGGTIAIECTQTDNTPTLSITDTGVGIPQADLKRIFTRFYRVDKSRTEKGNGLGLSLARAILRAHGGNITVKSNVGKGSKFTIIFPN